MGGQSVHELIRAQHGVVTRPQLVALGYSRHAIAHRLRSGRLFPVWRGVYAVGRPEVTQLGRWMAAVLACGRDAVLSHHSAAVLWAIAPRETRGIEVSATGRPRPEGIVVHRRKPAQVTRHRGIPVTTPICTLLDIAFRPRLAAAVDEADAMGLVDARRLHAELKRLRGARGTRPLRDLLDRDGYAPTRSELERRLLPVARKAGLPRPRTQALVNGYRVDFFWPEHGLVVETDGLRYHRTPSQQARDRLRDQAHAAAGLTCLRFTWRQVTSDPEHVRATLAAVVSMGP